MRQIISIRNLVTILSKKFYTAVHEGRYKLRGELPLQTCNPPRHRKCLQRICLTWIGHKIQSGISYILNVRGYSLSIKHLHVKRQQLPYAERSAHLSSPPKDRMSLLTLSIVIIHIAEYGRGSQMTLSIVPRILKIDREIRHPLRQRLCFGSP